MEHEAVFRMLNHVMVAHQNDRFGELNYVAGHLVVVRGFVLAALREAKGHDAIRHYGWVVECAALGHDLKEDHPQYWEDHLEEFTQNYGETFLKIVDQCTDDQDVKRSVRKQRQLDRITVMTGQRYSAPALLVKLGDWYSHLMPWGDPEKVPGAIDHALAAVKCVRLRLGKRPDVESAVNWASYALEHAANSAKARTE